MCVCCCCCCCCYWCCCCCYHAMCAVLLLFIRVVLLSLGLGLWILLWLLMAVEFRVSLFVHLRYVNYKIHTRFEPFHFHFDMPYIGRQWICERATENTLCTFNNTINNVHNSIESLVVFKYFNPNTCTHFWAHETYPKYSVLCARVVVSHSFDGCSKRTNFD